MNLDHQVSPLLVVTSAKDGSAYILPKQVWYRNRAYGLFNLNNGFWQCESFLNFIRNFVYDHCNVCIILW